MSLYYEAADVLAAPSNTGGSLKSRIFSNKNLKSQPAQVYALVVETSKWSLILKEVIEQAGLLTLERKLTPILSLLLVHDLLLAKKGITLPATHGLRAAVERHRARLQAELTKARIKRKLGSMEALERHVHSGEEDGSKAQPVHPRWIRINTLKTQLEDQLETTFADYERVGTVTAVRQRGSPRLYIDEHIPNLVAVPPSVDITKSDAYASGAIILQDKASCFPAYMLDPLPEDGDIIDTCAAPGNKATHVAAILMSHASELENSNQTINAFEKNKARAETLKKMVALADSQDYIQIHAGQDFLKVDPNAPEYRNVGALLLDPSCSGSGIVGRDDMPSLHLPAVKSSTPRPSKERGKPKPPKKKTLKRKRDDVQDEEPLDIIDDDGIITAVNSPLDLQTRLLALSTFQLSLLLHAFAFPSAHKITYSTCSIHPAENEAVVLKALDSELAKSRGWRILRREEQVRGMREWPIRGNREACHTDDENGDRRGDDIANACIRANKSDEYATMGFFLAGFVRDRITSRGDEATAILRDERGFIVRDLLGIPVRAIQGDLDGWNKDESNDDGSEGHIEDVDEEWNGFDDGGDDNGEEPSSNVTQSAALQPPHDEDDGDGDNDGATKREKNGKPTKKRKRRATRMAN